MEDDLSLSDDVDGGSLQSSGSSSCATPRALMRRPVTVRNGVMGCELSYGSFVDESNFHITSVKMKIKIKGMEAGWIITVSDVLGEEAEQDCFFTMEDVKSTAALILFRHYMSHLNPVHLCVNSITENSIGNHLMNRTNTFCRQQIEQGIPRVECIKQAAQCLGRQPGSNVWVLNEDMQFDSEGVRISNVQSEYIWLGGRIGKRNLPNVAPPTDAAVVPALAEPLDALRHPAMPHRNFKESSCVVFVPFGQQRTPKLTTPCCSTHFTRLAMLCPYSYLWESLSAKGKISGRRWTEVAGKRRNPDVSGVQKAASTAVNTQTASDGGDISQPQTPGDAGKSQSRTPSELEDIPYIRAGRQRQFPLPHFIRAVRYWPISVRAGR